MKIKSAGPIQFFRIAIALPAILGVLACTDEGPESVQHCIERFQKGQFAEFQRENILVEPTFTYDISRVADVFETILGGKENLEGASMTISQGSSQAALEAFYQSDVPLKGAFFSSEDVSLYRRIGAPGSGDETLAEGCRDTPPNAHLIHIAWYVTPPKTDD